MYCAVLQVVLALCSPPPGTGVATTAPKRQTDTGWDVPAPGNISVKNGCNFGYQGQLENYKNGFETRRSSNFRPFSFGSSRFNVQMGAQNGATTQFESQRRDICIPRSR
jgi:hypothetical protein